MTAQLASALAYDAFMGRWSKVVARDFLAWLSVPPHSRWLDVGCGTGALTSAILQSASPSEVWGIDPSEEYVSYARAIQPKERCHLLVADAQALPHEFSGFDATVSGLALNLVPDPIAAVAEMIRVTRPDGLVGAYVWDFADGMELLRYLWDAATKLDPQAEELDQGKCFPICHPDRLRVLFTEAGVRAIQVRPLEVPTIFRDFDDYWTPLLSGHGRAPGYVMSLSADQRSRLRESIQEDLPTHSDGSIHLTARAWAVRGMKGGTGSIEAD
jgi:SAM-dependent methyltransferase